MNLQMNAEFAVIRNSRANASQPWTRSYIGTMTYRKYRNLQKEAEEANSVISWQERQNGGVVGYIGIAISTLEGGIDGMALRQWIYGNTGKEYDVRTAKLLTPEVYNPNTPVAIEGLTVDELKDIHYAVRCYIEKGKLESTASRLCGVVTRINDAIKAVDSKYAY